MCQRRGCAAWTYDLTVSQQAANREAGAALSSSAAALVQCHFLSGLSMMWLGVD